MGRRLYQGLREFYFNGDPFVVEKVIKDIDSNMQETFDSTQRIEIELKKVASTTYGKELQRICEAFSKISDILFIGSQEINQMQADTIIYINKCAKFEGYNQRASLPNQFFIKRIRVDGDTTKSKNHMDTMSHLVNQTESYISYVVEKITRLDNSAKNISADWRDPQYTIFYDGVKDALIKILGALKTLDESNRVLKQKIIEYESN